MVAELLGGMGDGSHALGEDATVGSGTSQHWFPSAEDKVSHR